MAEGIAERKGGVGDMDERTLRTCIVRVLALMDGAVNAGKLLLRLREHNAGLQPGKDREVAVRIRIGERFVREQRLCTERKPDVRALIDAGSEEALRHDAADHKRLALNDQRGAQD